MPYQELLQKYHLEGFTKILQPLARPCLRGTPSTAETESFCGGLPTVDQGFEWPCKSGRPLDFVAQIACLDIPYWSQDQGFLLFFYDNEHWGLEASEKGYIQVRWQKGEREFEESRLPSITTKAFFGLLKKVYRPKVYQKVYLQFSESMSFPSEDRLTFKFPDEAEAENYCDFLEELNRVWSIFSKPLEGVARAPVDKAVPVPR